MSIAPSPPPHPLARVIVADVLAQARRLLAGGRIEQVSWIRSGLAGSLVAPNDRRFFGWVVLDRERRVVEASCSCSPKLRPGAVCPHLAALLLTQLQQAQLASGRDGVAEDSAGRELELPGERFERSIWFRAADAMHEAMRGGGPPAVRDGTGSETHHAGSGLRLAVSATGAPVALLSGTDAARLAPELALLFASAALAEGGEAISVAERRLRDLTRTSEEGVLALRGGQSRRQAVEASPWWLVAKRAFEVAFAAVDATTSVELVGGLPFVVLRRGDTRFALALLPRAVDVLHRETPGLLSALGLPFAAGTVRPVLRLELEPAGGLTLVPTYLVTRDGAVRLLDREPAERLRYGSLFLLPEEGVMLAVEAGRRPFAEPESGEQGSLGLEDGYRPSPIGQPLDRRTLVPPERVARFLTRHSEEIRNLDPHLLPPELAGGGPVEPSGAELVVLGADADRYLLDLRYTIDGRVVPALAILAARRKREPLLVSAGALVDPAHSRFAWMDALGADAVVGEGDAAHLRLGGLDVCRVRSYLPESHRLVGAPDAAAAASEAAQAGIAPVPVQGGAHGGVTTALERLATLAPDAPAPTPESLGIPLFDFQRTGYGWLWFLWRNGFGGLLCDDMGLGKTYQAIALVAAVASSEGRYPRVLVVCPASVLPHWEEKLAALAPSLPLRRHHGSAREEDVRPRPGVLLTTYGTLRNDAQRLAGEPFDLFVLDEAQTIKNRESATYQALRGLRARMILGLTGTPIENVVEELHTLLDFALPGYLPSPASFEKSFARPIAAGDREARRRLARLVRPFVLRRSKEQVLTSLPPKIEDRRRCVLLPEQRAVYDALLAGNGAALRARLATAEPVPYLHVFALLSKLKQVCNHPDLLLPVEAPPSGAGSGKWEAFVEILDEALGSGLKVVVFSQYLRMLDRIAAHLSEQGIGHVGLRGSTVDRAAPVQRFRDDSECRVFLASLKAAGVGIDLTAASVVIHYDRWWNQAREDQATDRVHRIGQRRGVQVITLISEDTVEERIDRLIRAKGRLAAELVPAEDARLLRRFTREELRTLLAPSGRLSPSPEGE